MRFPKYLLKYLLFVTFFSAGILYAQTTDATDPGADTTPPDSTGTTVTTDTVCSDPTVTTTSGTSSTTTSGSTATTSGTLPLPLPVAQLTAARSWRRMVPV